jgi:hypothetical protein
MEWQLLKAMRKDWNERLTIHFIYQYYIFLECGLGKIVFNTSCASAAPQGRNDFKIKNFVAREPLPGRVRNPDLDAGAKQSPSCARELRVAIFQESGHTFVRIASRDDTRERCFFDSQSIFN